MEEIRILHPCNVLSNEHILFSTVNFYLFFLAAFGKTFCLICLGFLVWECFKAMFLLSHPQQITGVIPVKLLEERATYSGLALCLKVFQCLVFLILSLVLTVSLRLCGCCNFLVMVYIHLVISCCGLSGLFLQAFATKCPIQGEE